MRQSKIDVNKFLIKYSIVIVFIVFLGLVVWLIMPYLLSIITACILSYICYPIYNWLYTKVTKEKKRISSILTVILVLIIVIIPLVFAISIATQSLSSDIKIIANSVSENEKISEVFTKLYDITGYNLQSKEFINSISQNLFDFGKGFVSLLPDKFISLFVILFLMYYLFISGPEIVKSIYEILPFKPPIKNKILKDMKDVTFAVVYGNLITAIAQATAGFIGYVIFGVSGAFFFAVLTGVFSFIPFLGACFIWISASVILFLKGQIYQAIGLALYGTFVISLIDNIIKPKIIGDRTNLHPAFVLIGVLGGIKVFGIIGIFVGPLLIATFGTILKTMKIFVAEEKIKKEEKKEIKTRQKIAF